MSVDPEIGGGASLTTDPAAGSSAATDVSLREHIEALRQADLRWLNERDRRYAEVAAEKEKALKIKETADLAALELARTIQTYKDEKANELRSQIERERGSYLARDEYNTAHHALEEKIDAALKPLNEFVSRSQGRTSGISASAGIAYALAAIALTILGIYLTNH